MGLLSNIVFHLFLNKMANIRAHLGDNIDNDDTSKNIVFFFFSCFHTYFLKI